MTERTSALVIRRIAELATPLGSAAKTGGAQAEVQRQQDVDVVCQDGRIAFIGSAAERRQALPASDDWCQLDATGHTLVPGFVDAHTHLPWAGSREHELALRLAGKSYLEIAAAGGGILSTVRDTRRASEQQLAAYAVERLDRMLAHGTTTAEVKSGYGLTLADELKQLRAIRQADAEHVIDLVPTLLAAHEFPPEYRHDRDAWVDEIVERIVPAVADQGLATFCDVFCERGVFDVEQTRRVLQAGIEHGLAPRLHADEFVDSGGAMLAAELGARSADHLVAVTDAGIEAMATSGVTGVMLPGVSFFLMKDEFAPARRLIEAGVPVVLATDCNPGSSHTVSLPFIIQLAVFRMGLTVEECLTAVTLNAAALLEVADDRGTIEVGKRADLTLLNMPNLLHLAYRMGTNPVAGVVKNGQVVQK